MNLYAAAEQNLLKLLHALIDGKLVKTPSIPDYLLTLSVAVDRFSLRLRHLLKILYPHEIVIMQ